jgi:Prophage antirepressor
MNNLALVKSEDFHGVQCDFWKDTDDDNYYMTTGQLVTALGYSDKSALSKMLERNDYLKTEEFSGVVKLSTPSGEQETRVFTEDGIYEVTMLAKTERAREFRAKVRQILKDLRRENARSTKANIPGIKPAIVDALETAEYLINKLGMKPGIAQLACIKTVEKNYGIDLGDVSLYIPAATHDTGYLTARDIGKELKISAERVNKILESIGLIEKQEKDSGKYEWRLTDDGKVFGEEFPYSNHGHFGYQIRWNRAILTSHILK